MELHSYAKRRTAKKWSIEQKRKLVEARINHDAMFVNEPRTSLRPWKKILVLAKLDDYNVFFVRKQWANLVSKYKAFKQNRIGNTKQIDRDEMQRLTQVWEFFQPIHLYMTRKTTNLHSYAARADTRKSMEIDREDREEQSWVSVSPTQYGSAFYSSDTNESRSGNGPANGEQTKDDEVIGGGGGGVMQQVETDQEFYWHHITTTGDTVEEDNENRDDVKPINDGGISVDAVILNDTPTMEVEKLQRNENKADTIDVIDTKKLLNAVLIQPIRQKCVNSILNNSPNIFNNTFIIGGGALSRTTSTNTTTNAATTAHQQPSKHLPLQTTPVGPTTALEKPMNATAATATATANAAVATVASATVSASYSLHSQKPMLRPCTGGGGGGNGNGSGSNSSSNNNSMTSNTLNQQNATTTTNNGTNNKRLRPMSERDKYYRHKRLFNRRLERRFDAILNVVGQVVRAEYPSIDVSPLLGAAAATGATINRLFSSDVDDDNDDDDDDDDDDGDGDADDDERKGDEQMIENNTTEVVNNTIIGHVGVNIQGNHHGINVERSVAGERNRNGQKVTVLMPPTNVQHG